MSRPDLTGHPGQKPGSSTVTPVPLREVVTDAVRRWFNETAQDAERGEPKCQALLSQMLAEGYGCQQDKKAADVWAEMARSRGFKMKGVYCEL